MQSVHEMLFIVIFLLCMFIESDRIVYIITATMGSCTSSCAVAMYHTNEVGYLGQR